MPLFLIKFLPLFRKALPFLKKHWRVVALVVWAAVFIGLFVARGDKIDLLELEQALYTQWADDMTKLNVTNLDTIASLQEAIKGWVEMLVVSETAQAAAYKAAQERARRAQVRLDNTRTQLRDLENETSTCAEISRIDIGAACPLSIELLQRAAAGTLD